MSNLLKLLDNLSPERRLYDLKAFAHHMYEAEYHERLKALFDNDEWMKVRFEGSNYTYDGFLADLEIAWADLEAMDEEAPIESAKRLPQYIRLGLISSSIVSSSKFPINLLISTVSTRYWSIDRMFSVVTKYSPTERVIAFTGLLMLKELESAERRKIQQKIYETVITTANRIPVRYLAALLPYLENNIAEEIIEKIASTLPTKIEVMPSIWRRGMRGGYEDERLYMDEAIDLLHLLPLEKRTTLIQKVVEAILNDVKSSVSKISEKSSKEEKKPSNVSEIIHLQFLHAIDKELDLSTYALHLEHLVPFLIDYPIMDEVLDQLVSILEIVVDFNFFKRIIHIYAPFFKGDRMMRVLRRTLILDEKKIQKDILSSLIPYVESTILKTVLDNTSSFMNDERRSIILNILAQQEPSLAATPDDNSSLPFIEARLLKDQDGVLTPANDAVQGLANRELFTPFFEKLGTDLWESYSKETSYIADSEDPLKYTHTAISGRFTPRDEEQKENMNMGLTFHQILRWLVDSTISYFNDEPLSKASPMSSSVPKESIHNASNNEDSVDNHDMWVKEILRLGSPAFLMLFASQLPDEILCEFIDEYFDPEEMAFQVFLLDFVIPKENDEDKAAEFEASIARIKGAMLKSVLKYAYQLNFPILNAWSTLPKELPSEADLSILLDFVLTLPIEPERIALLDLTLGDYAYSHEDSPRLQALSLFVPYLKGDLLLKAFRSVLEISEITIRKNALDMLAPYLGNAEMTRALEVAMEIPDALEQSWVLTVLSSTIQGEKREQIVKWEIEVALEITNGRHGGKLLAELLTQDATNQLSPKSLDYILNSLSRRNPNNRLDILKSLVQTWQGLVPEPILDAVLELPTVSDRGLYSWRADAITNLIDRFPEGAIDKVWIAIQDLPLKLSTGHTESLGWHWSYAYPFAHAISVLVPRLRGNMLEQAFEKAKQFYWTPREEIFQKLAPNADRILAGKILDFTLVMAEKYTTSTLSMQLLFEQEGAVVLSSIEEFRLERERVCAEIIAELAPKLDEAHLVKAVEKIWRFCVCGPRAWLTSKLAPYITKAVLKQILPIATIDALEFIYKDPTRFDLFIELLPHIRNYMEAETRPIKKLICKYFPERTNLNLSSEECDLLSEVDREKYRQLIEKHILIPAEKYQRLSKTQELSDQEQRKILEETILTPLIGSQIEQNIFNLIIHSPLLKRLEAFPELATNLSIEQLEAIVTHTFEEVLRVESRDEEELLKMLNVLIPYLPKVLHSRVISVALGQTDNRKLTEEDLTEAIYGEILRDFSKGLNPAFKNEPYSLYGQFLLRQWDFDQFQKSSTKLKSNRLRLLEILIPYLKSSLLAQVTEAVLQFKEIERIYGICILMPHLDGSLKIRVYEDILNMHSAFGRAFILWNVQQHLDKMQQQHALPMAISAALSLKDKTHQATALLTIMGLTDDGIQRASMLKLTLETITSIEDEGDALKILTIFTKMAASYPDLMEDVLKFILRLRESANQIKGLILLSRDNPQFHKLASKYTRSISSIITKHLHQSSSLERSSYLTELANLLLLCQSLIDDETKYFIAATTNEVCREWRWL